MNGLGNEIVVVDMRRDAGAISAGRGARRGAARRRAVRSAHGALSAAHARHRRLRAHLQQRRLRGGRLRQRHALHRRRCCSRRPARTALTFETKAGLLNAWKGEAPARLHRRHGRAALRLERDSAGRGVPRHPRDRAADRADRQADPAFALGGQHGQSARDLLGRRRRRLRPRQDRAAARKPSDLSRARQHLARAGALARAHRRCAPGSAAPA